jgi:hypothetical protein
MPMSIWMMTRKVRSCTVAGGSKKNQDVVKGVIKIRIVYPEL